MNFKLFIIGLLSVFLTISVSTKAFAYNLLGVRWPGATTTLHSNGFRGSNSSFNSAFIDALNQWNGLSNFSFSSINAAADPCVGPNSTHGWEFNSHFCGSSFGSATLAVAFGWWNASNELTDGGIVFNNAHPWDVHNGPGSNNDFGRVASHELGHALGLDHDNTFTALMNTTYSQTIETPQIDDINGLRAVYGGGTSCFPDTYEPDDGSGQATTIIPGSPQTHSICPVGDEDWMTFKLTSNSGVVLETSGSSGDTRMWLYDSSLNEIEFNDECGTNLFSRIDRVCGTDALPAGTYYVKIDEFGSDNEIVSYDISLTAGQCGSATYDATGTWSYSTTNNWVNDPDGIGCPPLVDETSTAVVTQAGDSVTLVDDGITYTGTVSGVDYTVTTSPPFPYLGGTVTATINFNLTSSTSGSGTPDGFIWSWTDGVNTCNGGADLSITKYTTDCTDNDCDGYGVGADCLGPDCDDRPNGEDGISGTSDDGSKINLRATEICGNGIDEDCDGQDSICVTWTDLVGVTVDGNTITKTASTGWGNSGAASSESFTGDGGVEYVVTQTNTSSMCGLSSINLDASYTSIEYAIYNEKGNLHVFESGSYRGGFGSYQIGDRLSVERVGSTIVYKKNGVVFYTSVTPTTSALLVDCAIYTDGGEISDVKLLGSNWTP